MKLYRVHQNLVSNLLRDIPAAVHAQLDAANLTIPKGEVAITAGSRGIANIATITKATGDWLKARGATPFIVPAMGSHNGATAAGQRAMIESLGITESAMAMEIRSSMDVVSLGRVATGEVFMDRHCFESAGVMVLNRIKLHTCFSGPVQSGIIKMMVVGMGKIQSATTFHETPTDQMKDMLLEMGRFIIDSGKLVGGVAILEDGLDETAEIHALAPDEVLQREPELLQKHQTYFPRLPVDNLDVLVVDEIGKTYSGTGMDTNVIGYRGVKHYEDLTTPVIRVIAALRLSPKSQGNAIGVGLADFITDGLRNAIDMPKTVVNALTTGDMIRAKLPVSLPTEADAIDMIRGRYGEGRWLFIPNTLHLETLFASEALRDELSAHPRCEVDPTPVMLTFKDGRHQLPYA